MSTFDPSNPAHLRRLEDDLAQYIAQQVLRVPAGSEAVMLRSVSPFQLMDAADRLEREQAEEANLVDAYSAAAVAVMKWVDSTPGVELRGCTPSMVSGIAVRALLDRFDIAPKAGVDA